MNDEPGHLMPERITSYLRRLGADQRAIARQYVHRAAAEATHFTAVDPLGEEAEHAPIKGIVHKYPNRALWKVSYRCAAHCQFCTRIRQIGSADGDLSANDIENGLQYIASHPKIDDVILSGGDPLFTPATTRTILTGLRDISTVKIIRVGTRMPLQSPGSINAKVVLELLAEMKKVATSKPLFLLLHINHPAELTAEVRSVVPALREAATALLSQTVFLRAINDDVAVLSELCRTLYYLGILPYYIYRCDEVRGLERFVCELARERQIMTELTSSLSGLCVPTYVVDVRGKGKLPIPLNYWDVPSINQCKDFEGQPVTISPFPGRQCA